MPRQIAAGDLLDVERLGRGARVILGRELTASEVGAFQAYFALLRRWQQVHRLVGSTEPGWVIDHLLLDSLLFSTFLTSRDSVVLDVGSGAGIPGVPLKITHPALRLTLLEPRRHRASFLAEVARSLGLTETEVLPLRSEEVLEERPELRGRFDVVLARCSATGLLSASAARQFAGSNGRIVVSGPPQPRPMLEGRWHERRHPTLGRPRWFHVTDGSSPG